MNTANKSFNPETLFSLDNPVFATARRTHQVATEAFDRSARLNLGLAQELLDLNRQRFEAIYAGESIADILAAQQKLFAEAGKRVSTYADEAKEIVTAFQAGLIDSANEWIDSANEAAQPAETKAEKKAA